MAVGNKDHGGHFDATVRFTVAGVTSLRCDFIEVFPLPANQLFECADTGWSYTCTVPVSRF
jgi:hypothetical protein